MARRKEVGVEGEEGEERGAEAVAEAEAEEGCAELLLLLLLLTAAEASVLQLLCNSSEAWMPGTAAATRDSSPMAAVTLRRPSR